MEKFELHERAIFRFAVPVQVVSKINRKKNNFRKENPLRHLFTRVLYRTVLLSPFHGFISLFKFKNIAA